MMPAPTKIKIEWCCRMTMGYLFSKVLPFTHDRFLLFTGLGVWMLHQWVFYGLDTGFADFAERYELWLKDDKYEPHEPQFKTW